MQFLSFSNELFKIIFDQLNEKDFNECRKVCKLWYIQIAPVYYQEIQLTSKHTYFLESISEKRFNSHRIGEYIKKLIIKRSKPDDRLLLEHEFRSLIFNLPCLDRLVIDNQGYYINIPYMNHSKYHESDLVSVYIQYLANMPLKELPKFKEMTIPRSNKIRRSTYKRHLELNYQLRDFITTVKFHRFESSWIRDMLKSQTHEFLCEFKKLKHLTLEYSRLEGQVDCVCLKNVMYACPNLEYLDLTNRKDQSETERHPYPSCLYPSLKYLKLVARQISLHPIDYICQQLPNLTELHLHQKGYRWGGFYLRLTEPQQQNLLRLLNRLDKFSWESCFFQDTLEWDQNGHENNWSALQNSLFRNLALEFYKEDFQCHLSIFILDIYELEENIYVDQLNKAIKIHIGYTDTLLESEDWDRWINLLPFSTIDILISQYDFDVNRIVDTIRELSVQRSRHISRICITSSLGRLYMGPIRSIDELSESEFNKLSKEKLSKLEPMEMVYLHHFFLNDTLLNTIHQISPLIKQIHSSCCVLGELKSVNLIDLVAFQALDLFVIDLYHFIEEFEDAIYFKLVSPTYSDFYIYDSEVDDESIIYLGRQLEMSDKRSIMIEIHYTKLNQIVFKLVDSFLFVSNKDDIRINSNESPQSISSVY